MKIRKSRKFVFDGGPLQQGCSLPLPYLKKFQHVTVKLKLFPFKSFDKCFYRRPVLAFHANSAVPSTRFREAGMVYFDFLVQTSSTYTLKRLGSPASWNMSQTLARFTFKFELVVNSVQKFCFFHAVRTKRIKIVLKTLRLFQLPC